MKSLIVFASAASALAIAMPAAAQGWSVSQPEKTGAYGELGYTGTTVHGADQSIITGRAGYRFNSFIGAEAELGVGVSGDNRTYAAGTPDETAVNVKQKTNEAAYVVGYLPLTPRADVFARVGYGAAQYKVNPAGLPDYNTHTDGFRYGAGAQYFLDGQNGVRVDYTRYDMQGNNNTAGYFGGDKSTSELSVAFSHRF